jgi:tetratricopeptide (TPR) repeat protein
MHRLVSGLILIILLSLLLGCWRGGSTSGDANSAANTVDAGTQLPEFSDADAALAEGSKLLDSGETEKAIDALNQAVKLNPDLAEAYFKLGVAYALIEKREQTSEVVDEAAAPTPKGKKTAEKKTRSEIAFEKAVDAYKKIIAANDGDDAAHFNLGRSYNKLNEDEDAAKELKQAVKLKPDDTEYQTELGSIMIKLAKYDEAIGPLKKALEIDPDNSRAQDLLDDAEAGKKRVDFATKIAPKDEKQSGKNANTANSNTEAAPAQPSPVPSVSPAAKPKMTPSKPQTP